MPARSLRTVCRRAERLRRLSRGARAALVASGGASVAGLLVTIGLRLLGMEGLGLPIVALPIAGALLGFAWSLVYQSRPLADAALALEEKYGLKTLLTTALALETTPAQGSAPSPLVQSILQDAEARARQLAPGSIVEWRLLRPAGFALAGAGLLAATFFYFPTLDLLDRREVRLAEDAQRLVRREEARRLEDLARELDVPMTESLLETETQKDIASELDRLADSLRDPRLSRDEAMLKVSDLKQKVKADREKLEAKAPKLNALALKDLKTAEARALAISIMNKEYAGAAGQAGGLAESLRSGGLSDEQQAALGGDLSRIAEALEGGDGGLSADLDAAGESLEANLPRAGAEHLDDLSERLEQLARGAEAERALAAAAGALDRARESLSDASGSGSGESSGQKGAAGQTRGEGAEGQNGAQGANGNSESGEAGSGEQGESSPSGSGENAGAPSGQGASGESGSQGGAQNGEAGSPASNGQSGANGASPQSGQTGDPSGAGESGSPGQSGQGAASGQPGDASGAGSPQGGGQPGQQPNGGGSPSGSPSGQQQGSGWGETPPESASQGDGGQSGGQQGAGQQGGQQGAGQQGGQGGQQGQQGGQQGSQGRQSGGGQSGGQSGGAGELSGSGAAGGSAASGGTGGGADWGVGSTNLEQGGGGGSPTRTEPQSRQASGEKQAWEEKFMSLYRERSIKAQTMDGRVQGQYGEGEELGWRSVDGKVERREPTAAQGDLFMETRIREKQSLDQQDIPFEYKDSVRRYFDSIEVPNP